MNYPSMKVRLYVNTVLNNEGCHIWLRHKDRQGYGTLNIRINGKHRQCKAHRVAFEVYIRPLEDWEEIDHLCYNTSCINPDHLEAVSKDENYKRRRNYKVIEGEFEIVNHFTAWIKMIDNMEAI